MKNLFKKFFTITAIIIAVSSAIAIIASPSTLAAGRSFGSCDQSVLGLYNWDCNVDIHDEASLKTGIWTIVANIATDITIIAAYLVLGYVIYGGYLYTFSGGEPGKVASGKKTLLHAFIGFAIVMGANVIFNSIRVALGANFTGNCVTGDCGTNPGTMVISAIHWATLMIGIVSAIFVVYGGISYILSSGDPGKVKSARQMIIYALIGLLVVALAEVITAWVGGVVRDATSYNNETIISKEVHEIDIN